jgi:thioredoxin-dependent peroxiredoxin
MVEEGKPAPDFELETDEGGTVRLSELRGKPVVLYFYPKDDTPGCTRQACAFRDVYSEFQERGAVVLGVSPDSVASHRKFKEKYELPFPLLADSDHEVADRYGAWREKLVRSTFVIDPDGTVARAMYGVNPEQNAGEVLEAL